MFDIPYSTLDIEDDRDTLNSDGPVFDALPAGVAPGGLRNKNEIMLLICYLLNTVGASISKALIGQVMREKGIANYFEVMDAISELCDIGNVESSIVEGEEYLTVTEQGKEAVAIVSESLPKTVRETAVKTTLRYQSLERNARENNVKIEQDGEGYTVSFSVTEENTNFMDLKVYVPDRDQAEILKRHFIEDPVQIYSTVMASLLVE